MPKTSPGSPIVRGGVGRVSFRTVAPPTMNPGHAARVAARLEALRTRLPEVIPAKTHDIVWEIGCGHGHFLARYAAFHPEKFCVGVDILNDRLRRAEKKQATAGVRNLKFIKAEAEEMLECLPEAIRFLEVLILFPDPWPKKRHHKNRLIQNGFLTRLAPRMAPQSRLFFRTDHEGYFQWTHDILSTHPAWVLVPGSPWILEEKTVFQAKAAGFQSLIAEVRTPEKTPAPSAQPLLLRPEQP